MLQGAVYPTLCPQDPQLLLSLFRSGQPPSQRPSPELLQIQEPALHEEPVGHCNVRTDQSCIIAFEAGIIQYFVATSSTILIVDVGIGAGTGAQFFTGDCLQRATGVAGACALRSKARAIYAWVCEVGSTPMRTYTVPARRPSLGATEREGRYIDVSSHRSYGDVALTMT